MTEKRPTPDETAGKGRRKRMAPTIDLTATEIPADTSPVTSEADPPPPPVSEAPVDTAGDPPIDVPPLSATETIGEVPPAADEPKEEPRKAGGFTMPLIAAGFVGAAAMTAALFTLWLTGLVPIRYAGVTAMRARVTGLEMQLQDLQKRPAQNVAANATDGKAIEALTQRIAKMEDALSKTPSANPALSDRVTAVDNAVKVLGSGLVAMTTRSDEIAASTSQARGRAEAAEKAVADLRASVQDVSKTANAGASSADLAPLQQRIDALEQSAKAANADIAKAAASDTAARRALSAASLRDVVLRGAPFTAELAQAKSLGADEKLRPLDAFAQQGLPTRAALALELRPIIAGIRTLQTPAVSGGFIERLKANASELVRVRPVDAPANDDPSSALARLESATSRNDIPAAIVELEKLRRPELAGYERSPQYFWIMKARAREAAADAVQAYVADTARSLGSK